MTLAPAGAATKRWSCCRAAAYCCCSRIAKPVNPIGSRAHGRRRVYCKGADLAKHRPGFVRNESPCFLPRAGGSARVSPAVSGRWSQRCSARLKASRRIIFAPGRRDRFRNIPVPGIPSRGRRLRPSIQWGLRLWGARRPCRKNSARPPRPSQSRLIALPGRASVLRGFSAVSLLIIDGRRRSLLRPPLHARHLRRRASEGET